MTPKTLQISSRLEGRLLIALVVAFTVEGAARATAQISFQPNPGAFVAQWGAQQQAIQEDIHRNDWARSRGGSTARSLAHPSSSGGSLVTTSYRPDPSVSARVRRQFLAFMARASGTRTATELNAAFDKTDPLANWARASAPDGMRIGDVADAMAEYWVTNWLMANGQTEASPARVRDVRDQVRRVLSASPAFSRLDNAGRQEMAEVLMYNAVVQASTYQDAMRRHDQALLQRASDAAVTRFRNEAHIDLRAVTLTPSGLAPKA